MQFQNQRQMEVCPLMGSCKIHPAVWPENLAVCLKVKISQNQTHVYYTNLYCTPHGLSLLSSLSSPLPSLCLLPPTSFLSSLPLVWCCICVEWFQEPLPWWAEREGHGDGCQVWGWLEWQLHTPRVSEIVSVCMYISMYNIHVASNCMVVFHTEGSYSVLFPTSLSLSLHSLYVYLLPVILPHLCLVSGHFLTCV